MTSAFPIHGSTVM